MNGLTEQQLADLAKRLGERKSRLVDEIRQVLARSSEPREADLVGAVGDAGDQSVAALLRDVAEAEVVRDIEEVSDIVAAQERIAAAQYGACADCSGEIGYDRLDAYPSAKRCLACQRRHEQTRARARHTGR
ncbi:MAG TPA: TraR/DksA C4-type zinc finger protein [Casimicrobiaceae bacterium]|jgi:RNA polymerase-binding transcription factor DksA